MINGDAIISASSDLDEYLIRDLKLQGAKITLWGVGTNLITSKDCVYTSPNTNEIKQNCKRELATLWDESRRLRNPQNVYVDLSQKLYDLKQSMIKLHRQTKSKML